MLKNTGLPGLLQYPIDKKGFYTFNPTFVMVKVIPQSDMAGCIIPDVEKKKKSFEAYVCKTLFPAKAYTLIWRSKHHHHTIFTFHDHATGSEFSVECIFRVGIIANSLQPLPILQNKTAAHFLLLGLGGTEKLPNQVFLIDFTGCSFKVLFKRHLLNKNINPEKAILSSQLWNENIIANYPAKKVA